MPCVPARRRRSVCTCVLHFELILSGVVVAEENTVGLIVGGALAALALIGIVIFTFLYA